MSLISLVNLISWLFKKKKPTTKKKHEAQLPANQTLKDELIFFFKDNKL